MINLKDNLTSPNIIGICESFLSNTVPNTCINFTGYNLYRYDRNKHGSGLVLYDHVTLTVHAPYKLGSETVQALVVDIIFGAGVSPQSIRLALQYRPPASPPADFLYVLQKFECLTEEQLVRFVVGDFNLPDIQWNTYGEPTNISTECSRLFIDFLSGNALKQTVSAPSRGNNYLELLCTDTNHRLLFCRVEPGLSDHNAIRAGFDLACPSSRTSMSKRFMNYNKTNFELLKAELLPINWFQMLPNEAYVDEIWNIFVYILQNVVSVCALQTTVTFNKNEQTLPRHIRHLRFQIRATRVRAKATNSLDWHCCFKAWRNNFRREIRKFKFVREKHLFIS